MKKAEGKKQKRGRMDFVIFIVTVILVLLGLVMMTSASYYKATVETGDAFYYLKRQLLGAALGIGAMTFFSNVKYTLVNKFRYVAIVGAFVLLVAVYIPGLGVSAHDSSRWVNLGFVQVQPAEVAKIALIIFMSSFMAKNRKMMDSLAHGVFPVLAVVGVASVLIILQPNFSMVLCICMMTFVMLFVGGAKKRHLAMILVVGLIGATVLLFSKDYRIERLTSFLDPWSDPSDSGYQLIQSFYSIASGGLLGRGIGMSQQKMLYLPFGESDFIFSIMTEEIGFIGVFIVIALYFVLIWRGIRVALKCPDRFGSLLAAGVTTLLAIQVAINIAVVTGSIPPTGQPLPFISYGSSSLVIFLAAMGILLNVSRYCAKE